MACEDLSSGERKGAIAFELNSSVKADQSGLSTMPTTIMQRQPREYVCTVVAGPTRVF